MSTYNEYIADLIGHFWDYAENEFASDRNLLDRSERSTKRPPVFVKEAVEHNILFPPDASPEIRRAIVASIPSSERHIHFGSMRSSQALAQSVFGGLSAMGRIGILADLEADDGAPAFFDEVAKSQVQLEFAIDHLGEPRPTSVDVWFDGKQRVAVECKLTEPEFGQCSRPKLLPKASNYYLAHCDGTYTQQRDRQTRCSLTEIGVDYWEHIPKLFRWSSDADLAPCPLRDTYQLTRNVLAACIRPDGTVNDNGSHALVIYDERNPAYQSGGDAERQWDSATEGLRDRGFLRRCSWQRLATHIARDPDMAWLVRDLADKYGIRPFEPC